MCESEASFLRVHSSQKVSHHEPASHLKVLSTEIDLDKNGVIL